MNTNKPWWPIVVFWANLLIIIAFWLSGSVLGQSPSTARVYIDLGRITGLLLAYFLLVQVILIGRVSPIERVVGHDRLARWHRLVGIWSAVFLLAHPICLAIGYSLKRGISLMNQLFNFAFMSDDLGGALVATVILLLIIILSSGKTIRKWSYEGWYVSHLLVYPAIFLSFEHQIELGGDFRQAIFIIYWYALFIFFLGTFVFSRFLKPLDNFRRFRFRVSRVVLESDSTYSIFITGHNLANFRFKGGQFGLFRFLSGKLWLQAHPFSFSSLSGDEIRVSIKKLGDFTNILADRLKPGTPVLLEGPLGVFTIRPKVDKYLLLAGGIGVTPIRALAEDLVKAEKDVKAIYAFRNEPEAVFDNELKQLLPTDNYFRFNGETTTDQPELKTYSGLLTLDRIKELVPDWPTREIYICGPGGMARGLYQDFFKAGVRRRHFHWEHFDF